MWRRFWVATVIFEIVTKLRTLAITYYGVHSTLQVGGLKIVQQLLAVHVLALSSCLPSVGFARDEEVPLLVAVRPLMHQQQLEQV